MAKAGSLRKGEKRLNQGKHGSPKASKAAREALARFVEGNTERLQEWLDQIAEQDGPKAAFQCFVSLIEFHVPKLARRELVGGEDGPMTLEVRWLTSGEMQA